MKNTLVIILISALIVLGDRVATMAISKLLHSSEFRFSKLYTGRVLTDVAIFGNSRALHSLYAPELNQDGCYFSYQLSYNGLSLLSVEQLIYDYLDKNPSPKVIILEVSVFYSEQVADKQLSIYKADSPRIEGYLNGLDSSLINWPVIFNLLDYNSQMLVRSLIHLNKTDQNWINRGKLLSSIAVHEGDQKKVYSFDSYRSDALERLYKKLSEDSINLILYAAPYHSNVSQLVQNPYTWDKEVSFAHMDGVDFLDFRRMETEDENYTDYLHLNIDGARFINDIFNNILVEKLGCEDD